VVKVVMKEMMNWCEKDDYKQAHIVIAFVHIVHIVNSLFLFISAMFVVCIIFLFLLLTTIFLVNKDV